MRAALLCASALCASACSTPTFDYIEELDTVLTVRAPDRDFSGLAKFGLHETVEDLTDLIEDSIEVDHSFDELILDTIASNMTELGWEQVDDPMSPEADVVLTAGIVASNNWVLWGFTPWVGYGGWWWWWPPVTVPVNFPTGSVVVVMAKPDEEFEQDGRRVAPAVWSAAIRGLLGSNDASARRRIETSLDQAFAQSPYLKVGGAR